MRKAIAGLAAVIMFAIVVQFFLAGSGAFDTASVDEAFRPHRMLGYLIVLLSAVTTLIAASARVPGRLVGMTGLLVGLGIAQPVIAAIAKAFSDTDDSSTAGQLVFGLHAVNALVMMAVAVRILRLARELPTTPAPAAGPTPGPTR
ncbi:DUF6220 domain-containing protein [Streptomyces acidiscabies]|uniref:DUF6220 domain-containing protein n=1 Tax=Streptomyces acidiscabies TaxID=42234 RepID=A0AAP6BC54_9ACTN|nr:DUF6220 domain-containing protein [Streptomyces acidiscabies]MBZ3917956.1 hypothetical protein [Streptomyces acidiscabies]MDX2961930.1 DUF6220 domain-containing protein [Streptomyces acidiscabies]MDX3021814.1 DUF6220 domain-containing protein [Streptomyces acidiscabies]MDX3789471.1 DUF6220 domain-containing protein [Streptomyces acidiscabies]GAQ50455.1 hypothetical protein a10_00232 [Streptomyces acidiscabies]